MTAEELFSRTSLKDYPFRGDSGKQEIELITCDSRKVTPNSIFVCVKGSLGDGHDYAEEALAKGAAWIVAQRDCGVSRQILAEDTRKIYSELCGAFFGNPAQKLRLTAVTGTNGKTTSTWLLHHALQKLGVKAGLVGTVYNHTGREMVQANYTTPDAWQLHQLLARMKAEGCTHVVLEASSQAIDQQRLYGCTFDCGIFTNLSPEHLDYHPDLESYYQAKKQLFSSCKKAAVNVGNPFGKRLAEELLEQGMEVFSFSAEGRARLAAAEIELFSDHCQGRIFFDGKEKTASLSLPGKFSMENFLTALSALLMLGFPFEESVEAVSSCPSVPGRTEVCLCEDGITVIRDYAHTPDSLEKMLSAMKEFCSGRLITVFGCPGRRDRTKRPLMAKAVCRYADFAVMTADNPREESLDQIFSDAMMGLDGSENIRIIADRKEAIRWALTESRPKDTVILAGKGHENYQVLKDKTIFFDEKQLVNEIYLSCKEKK